MVTAIISDIHGNLDALDTVLADIDKRGVDRIVCLGDIIGYGPNPREVIDRVADRCEWALMGNHDFAALYEPTNFNLAAESAAFWTRRQLELEPDFEKMSTRWHFLGELLVRHEDNGFLCVHASPRRPINEYIFPDDVFAAPGKMQTLFERIQHRCLVGHTHVTGVFTDEPDFYPPGDLGGVYAFSDEEKCFINPGSVGQPRDRDPRASYAIAYDDRVEFFRLEYDIDAVAKKIQKTPELSDMLGNRLYQGK